MTEAKYTEAYKKACSAQPNSRISSTVQAVYEAHRFDVKRLEHIIQKLVLKPSAEEDVLLRHYRNQQNVTHMMSTTTVEEFYVLAISQSDSASPIFLSTLVSLESRNCSFEITADSIMSDFLKNEQQPSSGPIRIVGLLFEGTNLQRDLRIQIKNMLLKDPLQFVGLNDEQLVKVICRSPVYSGTTSAEQVILNLSFAELINYLV